MNRMTIESESQSQKTITRLEGIITRQRLEIEHKNKYISALKEKVSFLEEEIFELEKIKQFTIDQSTYDNLRGRMVVEKMFNNLNYLPISELESLVEKYAVL